MSGTSNSSSLRWTIAMPSVVAILCLATVNAWAATGSMAGTALDSGTGLPLGRVIVQAHSVGGGRHGGGHGGDSTGSFATTTDEGGSYALHDMPEGVYLVRARLNGYFPVVVEAEVFGGLVTTVDVGLERLIFGSVRGTVRDAFTGLPVSGARVILLPRADTGHRGPEGGDGHGGDGHGGDGHGGDGHGGGGQGGSGHGWGGLGEGGLGGGSHGYRASTGADGTYVIENVPIGEYLARAMTLGFVPSPSVPLAIVDGEATVQDFALEAISVGRLEGHVTDALTGEPIPGAFLALRRHGSGAFGPRENGDGDGRHSTRTDAEGFYRFDILRAGTYPVRVSAAGYGTVVVEVTVLANTTSVADFVLSML